MTDELPTDWWPPRGWLNPNVVDYKGQYTPHEWHNALVAVLKLRPPQHNAGPYLLGWREALQQVHDTVARELGLTS